VSFAQAASAPTAALTALQALRDAGGIQSGDRVSPCAERSLPAVDVGSSSSQRVDA